MSETRARRAWKAPAGRRWILALAAIAFGVLGFLAGMILMMTIGPCGNNCEPVGFMILGAVGLYQLAPPLGAILLLPALIGWVPRWLLWSVVGLNFLLILGLGIFVAIILGHA